MRNKTLLVANREFLENARTKTFWIGIIFIPILIAVSIAVPALLEKTKDVRKFAVIDHSGWLLEEVERRATLPDLEKVFRAALDDLRNDAEEFAEYPPAVQEIAQAAQALHGQDDTLQGEDAEAVRQTRRMAEAAGASLDEKSILHHFAEGIILSDSPKYAAALRQLPNGEALLRLLEERRAQIRDWYLALPPKEAAEYAGGARLSKSRYQRVDVPPAEGAPTEALNQQVAKRDLFAYFVIPEQPEENIAGSKYVSQNLTDDELKNWFERYATEAVRERRIQEEGISPEAAAKIQESVSFEGQKVSKEGKVEEVSSEDTLRQWAPVVFVYLLWLAVFSITQMLLTNTIEEKSNRILEVLLSSVSPIQLMIGKILGIAITGLTVILSWVICFVVMVRYIPGMLGVDANINLLAIARDPAFLASFVTYFVLGYLFFAAFLVGIGSVCNSIKEANNLMMPVTVVLMIPLMAMIPISRDPNGKLAIFLSYVPPFTPFVMMNRAAGPPQTWEYVVTTILLIVSILVAMWGAAKIFRIGVLMTGKAPTPLEMLRWLKAPVGQVPVQHQPGEAQG